MKTPLAFWSLFFMIIFFSNSSAQSIFADTAFYYKADLNPVMGRDFWFTPPALFQSNSKFYDLCVTSPKNASVHIECGTFSTTLAVKAGLTTAYLLPLTHEITSSGIIEDNCAYHVWCDTADLDLMLVADNPAGAAGGAMHILPAFALGEEYVVASYTALYIGQGNSYDYPSEMTITAEEDNTVVTIVPSADLRQETQADPNPTTVAHPTGMSFPVTLQRGETVQFQTVTSQDPDNYDLTGTIIHSNYPVAVIGASQRPYIPATVPPVWNYIANMIPPTRSWGNTYYTAPFAQPSGVTTHDASTFLVVGSQANQTIYRYDATSGSQVFCLLQNKFDIFWDDGDVDVASRWTSDAPFMLVQYIDSRDYPDSTVKAFGAPAMMVVPPQDKFATSGRVQTPQQIGSYAASFTMYVNVIVNTNAKSATFDGTNIRSWTNKPIDSAWSIYRGSNITQGAHVFQSDMPIGVNAYGYAPLNGESIGYPAENGLIATASSDTVAPSIIWTANDGCALAAISDSGSGLSQIVIDSGFNFTITSDTNFIAGDSIQSSFLGVCLTNADSDGYVTFTAYDMAGNRSVGEITYVAPAQTSLKAGFTLASIGFDTVRIGTSKTLGAVTLTDTSSVWPITFDSIWIDNPVFTDTAQADKAPMTITPGQKHTFQITFSPTDGNPYTAFLHAQSTSAGAQKVSLDGSGYTTTGGVAETSGTLADWLANGSGNMMLFPPSPNPAMKSLTINYALRAACNIEFEIFSERGTKVYDWNGSNETNGLHTQTFDIDAIETGNYIYRFSANGEVESGKIAIKR
jgi:hypothetical protein